AKGAVKPVFEFHQKQFVAAKWSVLPNSYITDQSASATFARDGYKVSLSVFPGGSKEKEPTVNVSITNHGNVDTKKLPVPSGANPFYDSRVSTAYLTEVPVEKTADAVRKLLEDLGWEPYGTAGNSLNFKQNAVMLTATVSSAPAQGGKTVIDYSSE